MGGPAISNGENIPATDNFLVCKFVIDGLTWISAEQYFQSCKFTSDNEAFSKIRNETDGMALWAIGRAGTGVRPDWESVKVDTMYKAVFEKFQQNADLKAQLLATGSSRFSFPPEENGFWAEWNAKILETVREQLKPPDRQDTSLVDFMRQSFAQYSAENRK